DSGAEKLGGLEHREGGHVPAVRPAVDPDPVPVDVRERGQPARSGDLILDLDGAETPVQGALERAAAARRAAIVEPEDDVTLPGKVLRAQVLGQLPRVLDRLRRR